MMQFAVSTMALRKQGLDRAIEVAREEDFALEFSSGVPFREGMDAMYLSAPCRRLPHNYFPAPREPFVLNLASCNSTIIALSRSHCERGLHLAAQSNAPFYSAHAGFCLDPQPHRLGKPLQVSMEKSRAEHWKVFIESVTELAALAESLGIRLLIENNVLASFNVCADGQNPLLCADPYEIRLLVDQVRSDALGILIDTGHWKVSSLTLGFPLRPVLSDIAGSICAFHHSDNDGTEDANLPIGLDYWFLAEMSRFADAVHVLEVDDQSVEDIRSQRKLLQDACSSADKGAL